MISNFRMQCSQTMAFIRFFCYSVLSYISLFEYTCSYFFSFLSSSCPSCLRMADSWIYPGLTVGRPVLKIPKVSWYRSILQVSGQELFLLRHSLQPSAWFSSDNILKAYITWAILMSIWLHKYRGYTRVNRIRWITNILT